MVFPCKVFIYYFRISYLIFPCKVFDFFISEYFLFGFPLQGFFDFWFWNILLGVPLQVFVLFFSDIYISYIVFPCKAFLFSISKYLKFGLPLQGGRDARQGERAAGSELFEWCERPERRHRNDPEQVGDQK